MWGFVLVMVVLAGVLRVMEAIERSQGNTLARPDLRPQRERQG